MIALSLLAAAVLAKSDLPLIMAFDEWRQEFEPTRSYTAKGSLAARQAQFEANMQKIKAQNLRYDSGASGFYMGVTQFTDLNADEFLVAAGLTNALLRPKNVTRKVPKVLDASAMPSSIDWRQRGGVTPIKDQGQCGSCWSFSSTGAIEGSVFARTGQLVSLSEKELVDCDSQSFGCEGGLMQFAFEFVVQNGGIDSEGDWPYQPQAATCETYKEGSRVAAITGHEFVTVNNADQLMAAAANAPVSVSLSADADIFGNYRGGVIDSPSCALLGTHAVLVVGYTEANANQLGDAFIVKNSWGERWGDAGFFYVSRTQEYDPKGICGILNGPIYPTGGRLARGRATDRLAELQK